jgi:hypothetical protein
VTVDTTNFEGNIDCPADMAYFCNTDNLPRVCADNCNYGGMCLSYNKCSCGNYNEDRTLCVRPDFLLNGNLTTIISGIFLLAFMLLA